MTRRVLLLLVLFASAARAEDVRVHFRTIPPDVVVYREAASRLGREALARTGEGAIPLDSREVGRGGFTLLFVDPKNRHGELRRSFGNYELRDGTTYPDDYPGAEPLRLPPRDVLTAVQDAFLSRPAAAWGFLVLGLGGALGLLGAAQRWWTQRQSQRANDELRRHLEALGDQLGLRIGPYRALRRLGTGSMGNVFLAVPADRVEAGERVALKTMHPSLFEREKSRRRFEREIRLLTELSHPNLVSCLAFGEFEEGHYLAMEWVAGANLEELLEANPPPYQPARSLALLGGIFAAVAYLHQNGIIHRDIKPLNIMVEPKGNTRLVDLGLGRRVDPSSGLTEEDEMLGTYHYMAPEVFSGGEVRPASDQFALGSILYRMLSGRRPYRREDEETAVDLCRFVRGQLHPLAELRPDLPAGFVEAVERMLRAEPEERFESVSVALHVLTSALKPQ